MISPNPKYQHAAQLTIRRYQEYLQFEETNPARHEYVGGRWNTILEYAARGRCSDAGCVDVVLQSDRNSMKGAAPLPTFQLGFHFARGRKRLIARDRYERVDRFIVFVDSIETRLREVHR